MYMLKEEIKNKKTLSPKKAHTHSLYIRTLRLFETLDLMVYLNHHIVGHLHLTIILCPLRSCYSIWRLAAYLHYFLSLTILFTHPLVPIRLWYPPPWLCADGSTHKINPNQISLVHTWRYHSW